MNAWDNENINNYCLIDYKNMHKCFLIGLIIFDDEAGYSKYYLILVLN